ncbi:MAG: hypothetical protein H0V81_08180 [Solirubrobacterales bacterium]|nr:hypothetical protein [Solirubrobacterales bacterium]
MSRSRRPVRDDVDQCSFLANLNRLDDGDGDGIDLTATAARSPSVLESYSLATQLRAATTVAALDVSHIALGHR